MNTSYSLIVYLVCPAVKHTLKFFCTASSGVPNFPQFMGVVMVDDILAGYCDSNKNIQPKQDWVKKILEKEPQELELYTGECFEIQPNSLKAKIDILKKSFNRIGGKV